MTIQNLLPKLSFLTFFFFFYVFDETFFITFLTKLSSFFHVFDKTTFFTIFFAKHFIMPNFIWQTSFSNKLFGKLHLAKICLAKHHLSWIGCTNPFPGFARFARLKPKMKSQTHAKKRGEILYRLVDYPTNAWVIFLKDF